MVIKYPEKELNIMVDKYIDMYTEQAKQYGMTFEQYLSAYGITEQQLRENLAEQLKSYVKRDLIVFYILNQYPELMLEESEYDTRAEMFYNEVKASGNYTKNFEDFKKDYSEFEIITGAYTSHVIEYLGSQAIILDAK